MKLFFIFILASTLFALSTHAQSTSDEANGDPLQKPEVWRRLQMNPMDEALWSHYFGKDLFELSDNEYSLFTEWKTQLIAEKEKKLEKRKKEAEARKMAYLQKRAGFNNQNARYDQLRQNINQNFAMIEEFFQEQFKLYGQTYSPYLKEHPDRRFSRSKWVEEHEVKLELLKQNQ